jgi:hypothetical protein
MQDADSPAPPVNPSRLFPNIIHYCRSEGEAARLALDRQLMSARFLVIKPSASSNLLAPSSMLLYHQRFSHVLSMNLVESTEIGINEWEDRTGVKVFVPSTMRWQTICHGIRRNLKRI